MLFYFKKIAVGIQKNKLGFVEYKQFLRNSTQKISQNIVRNVWKLTIIQDLAGFLRYYLEYLYC